MVFLVHLSAPSFFLQDPSAVHPPWLLIRVLELPSPPWHVERFIFSVFAFVKAPEPWKREISNCWRFLVVQSIWHVMFWIDNGLGEFMQSAHNSQKAGSVSPPRFLLLDSFRGLCGSFLRVPSPPGLQVFHPMIPQCKFNILKCWRIPDLKMSMLQDYQIPRV